MRIINYNNTHHRDQLIKLWIEELNYIQPRNDPGRAIDRKLAADDNLLFIAEEKNELIGSIMAGYDGHRGWIYSLAVKRAYRNKNVGTSLLKQTIRELASRGCPKINLQILYDNKAVQHFYEKNGFSVENG